MTCSRPHCSNTIRAGGLRRRRLCASCAVTVRRCARILRGGRPCRRRAFRQEHCTACRQALRKQALVEQAKQRHGKQCACGKALSVYSRSGLCAGCAGRAALAGYRRGELPAMPVEQFTNLRGSSATTQVLPAQHEERAA